MSDFHWYKLSLVFRTDEKPPTDPWLFIQWFRQAMPIAYDDINVQKEPDSPRG